MPPVRWRLLIVPITICLVQCVSFAATDAQHMQDLISMTADGWRPIVGTRRQPSFKEEITHYRNPIANNESVKKAETPTPSSILTTTAPVTQNFTNNNNAATSYKKFNSKIPAHTKHNLQNSPYYNGGAHGPHIPLGGSIPSHRPTQLGPVKKFPQQGNNKYQHSQVNGKRVVKPNRGQVTAHSTRNEVYAPAPNSGTYSFISQGQNNVKTRDTPGLGLLGTNHFSINQPNSHFEFTNRFPLPPVQNENLFQSFNGNPTNNFNYHKHPQSNDVHYNFQNQNDDYTRNLVPPPQPQNKDILKTKENIKTKGTYDVTEASQQNNHFIKNPIPQNIAIQLPPPFEQQANKFSFTPNEIKTKDHTEVEVTKQKLKVFHNNIPPNYNPLIPDFIDYDFHSVKRPTDLPKLQTYEVTEGKHWQETPPFHYRFPEPQLVTQPPKKPQVSRRPVIEMSRPIIELNLPPFLPTPYKPEGVVPTSPTQDEVSTIFTYLSTKVKNNEYQTPDPFFDIKEVSTHFPILGRPEIKPEIQTEFVPYHETELTNEVTTTARVILPEETTTLRTTTKDPQRVRGSHRRRRPSNRLRTTTEEPVQTESYELQKTQENETELSSEIEKPLRRRPIRYRTTTPAPEIEEPTTRATRGRNRYRHRQNSNESLRTNSRKRLRPTDMPSNHKMTQIDLESNEYRQTTEEASVEQVYSSSTEEVQGIFESSYSKEPSEEEDIHTRPNKYEYEAKYQIPSTNNDIEVVNNPTIYEITEKALTTEVSPTTNIHIPENEIDYSTPDSDVRTSPVTEEIEEVVTLATTIPTTTTTEETTTTKSHRIRGRPVKYDSSNRPRFSVKDYRQRLNQYTSTSTTTESYRTTSESLRIRFPNRSRRPVASTTTVSTTTEEEEEDQTEPFRPKFKPKEPRHGYTTEANENIITEKTVKAVNTRLRPFARQRSTTEPTSTSTKVSIKPNLFSQRRRPSQLSLKNRIMNKLNKTEERTTTESELEEDETEPVTQSTISYEVSSVDSTTEYQPKKLKTVEVTTEEPQTTTDILKNESIFYSQRVSDLTSSAKNEYNTPGVFKSVSPTSRRIPSYFTISTDDPILPIEAFFPNIKDNKDKE